MTAFGDTLHYYKGVLFQSQTACLISQSDLWAKSTSNLVSAWQSHNSRELAQSSQCLQKEPRQRRQSIRSWSQYDVPRQVSYNGT